MSLFQNRSDFGVPDHHDPDVVHLGSHGCDVLFGHYSAGTQSGPGTNRAQTRSLVIQGRLRLDIEGTSRIVDAGDWFEIPPGTEYCIHFATDCSLIEFCFAVDPPH